MGQYLLLHDFIDVMRKNELLHHIPNNKFGCTISVPHARICDRLRNHIEQLSAEYTLHSILCLRNMLSVT